MNPLDNPIFEALNTEDSNLNRGDQVVAYFDEEVSPFLAMKNWDEASQHHALNILPKDRSWSVMIANPISFIKEIEVLFSIPLYQMVCLNLLSYSDIDIHVQSLNDSNIPEMLALTALTKPGPFMARTIDFGNYIGIFEENKLVSMAGERMHLRDYTEISAVCTDPNHLGKRYGSHLVSMLANQIIQKGKTPLLHVRYDNIRAIEMYKRLGFEIRSEMFFAVFKKK